jgi:hypothetical protein
LDLRLCEEERSSFLSERNVMERGFLFREEKECFDLRMLFSVFIEEHYPIEANSPHYLITNVKN